MDITEFLLARIAEDEAAARASSGSTVEGQVGSWTLAPGGDEWAAHEGDLEVEVLVALRPGLPLPPRVMEGKWSQLAYWETYDANSGTFTTVMPVAQHIARHDPARVLRECAAKRELVDAWHDEHGGGHVLKTLAAVYSDHPDYRQEWSL